MTTQNADLQTTMGLLEFQKIIMLAQLFDEYPMLLFVLEAFLALAILLAIVFWTGKGRRD
ncbi:MULTISPECIES: hypothetical protein [unclassified Polynucleobacter]|uniref:hypothetical protein n=1 Tax=unclassified Polynucleobacter TaxID=2640945 RepID=UPI002572F0C5|nr:MULTISPECIES: hypothetical protein [unclassified Polynucleobacter]BEI34621.1 hypothetical protein PHIN6_01390 [Polynucleobacter sp. HIN6]BEI36416.1 hypothetical protein PHIN7_01400 [Polynucleobacter sp. HIN7]BEI40207.1 hypothetical protein PHIN9_01380 [Polynucleobacter sp. HIN9]BEI41989.1 hypothetical protein PHIN10_01380 [Polynucleobacter sp. HIN10]BEI43766.1 hypothetical protein PHIN11_01380 [Polynucleobacter sp. HIN11]